MQRNFCAAAARLSAVVSLALGWTIEQFWQSTPAELSLLFAEFQKRGIGSQNDPMLKDQLDILKEKYPDG